MAMVRRSKKQLRARKIKNLKALARKIDSQESESIRARGRAAFARHERLRSIVQALRAQRLSQGMSLSALARKSGIAKPNLSRLENSAQSAPNLDTLERYARAVGMSIRIELAATDAA
jgi:DNA-binding Xre family transcriptional regulator